MRRILLAVPLLALVAVPGRADDFLNQLSDPTGELAHEWNRDHDSHVVAKLLALVQADFTSKTWQAFQRFALDGVPAEQVAAELGLSANAVFIAKSRVLSRLREEGAGLID